MDVIAERAAAGDGNALAELVRQNYAGVFRFCSRLLDAQHAEDAAQETFYRASKLIRKFRGESEVKTWLFGIALNVCRNEKRKLKVNTLPLQDWDVPKQSPDLISVNALRAAMSQLDESHRDVVILHEMEGFTYEECASALQIPIGTVKSRLYNAFIKLRRLLEPEAAL